MNILMVCLGNICRSPLAQGILEHKATSKNISIYVDSAGTSSFHVDEAPDYRSIQVARKYQIDISNQRGRQFTATDFDTFDWIFAMDISNFNNIISLARSESDKQKVSLILDVLYPGKNQSVPDPYYGGQDGFEHVYNLLDKACEKILESIEIR